MRGVVLLLVSVALASFVVGAASARVWHVDDDLMDFPRADFTSIQAAINAASPGDSIIVHDGTYHENVVINKSLRLVAAGRAAPVIDGGGVGNVVTITADGCLLSGFTVTNSGTGFVGVAIESDNNRVFRNTITGNHEGIHLNYSSNNIILANNISYNRNENIYVVGGAHNIIIRNTIGLMGGAYGILARHSQRNLIASNELACVGICLYNSSWNRVIGNEVRECTAISIVIDRGSHNAVVRNVIRDALSGGIVISDESCWNLVARNEIEASPLSTGCPVGIFFGVSADNNVVVGNNISAFYYGIEAGGGSGHNRIIRNSVTSCTYGIMFLMRNSTVRGNHICGNVYGIYFIPYDDTRNAIISNNIVANEYGLYIYRPVDSIALGNDSIYLNNFIDNVDNVYSNDRYANNAWSSPVVRYVYNGTEYTGRLGNYWDDYAGVDADGDGVGEAGYAIDAYNVDQYPLVEPSENYRILL